MLGMKGFLEDRRERDRLFGRMAPFVTKAAEEGSQIAQAVCDRAIHQLTVGIDILGSCFSLKEVAVSYIGSVMNSPYMKQTLTQRLEDSTKKKYIIQEPALSTVYGAVLTAFHHLHIPTTEKIINNMKTNES